MCCNISIRMLLGNISTRKKMFIRERNILFMSNTGLLYRVATNTAYLSIPLGDNIRFIHIFVSKCKSGIL